MPLLPEGLWKLIVSFLDNRMFAVDIRRHLSGLRQIRAGVPQGSVLGPVLYTIYTSDLPNPVARGTLLATYADDTALNDVECWASRWNIALNVDKTQHVTSALRPGRFHSLYLDGDRLKHEQKVTYLGVTLDRRLCWKSQIDRDCGSARTKLDWTGKWTGYFAQIVDYPFMFFKAIVLQTLSWGITC